MFELRQTELGGLGCRVALPRGTALSPKLAVVLCHGYGAPGDDLVPLAEALGAHLPEPLAQTTRFYFPQAPHAAQGVGFGRAWWQLDPEILMSMQRGGPRDSSRIRAMTPPGLTPARRSLLALLEAVSRSTGLAPDRIVVGGFSQGAMLATDVALRQEEAPASLVALSGTLLCAAEWQRACAQRSRLPVFVSHGHQDPLLSFDDAEALVAMFRDAGLAVQFEAFRGGHEIPGGVLRALATHLVSLNVGPPSDV